MLALGPGSIKNIASMAKIVGGKNALLVCTPSKRYVADVTKQLNSAGISVMVFDKIVPNPLAETCDEGARIAVENKVDLVVAIGGGSVMDSAKAIAIVAADGGKAWDYVLFRKAIDNRVLPVIAVTTTSGTGSQMTQIAVMSKFETKEKCSIISWNAIPRVAIVDPKLMLSVSRRSTIETGFDAFAHSFEAFTSQMANPMTDHVAFESMRIISMTLKPLTDDLENLELRSRMALADTYAGMALTNAGATIPHAMAEAMSGVNHNLVHGHALALAYPAFLKFCVDADSARERFTKVGKLFDPSVTTPHEAIETIQKWIEGFGLPRGLGQAGFDKSDIPALVSQCVTNIGVDFPPRTPKAEDFKQFFEDIW